MNIKFNLIPLLKKIRVMVVQHLSIQYWTSRGIGVADVNYGGSTGYGKEYRQRLPHPSSSWGLVDVDDAHCIFTTLSLLYQYHIEL